VIASDGSGTPTLKTKLTYPSVKSHEQVVAEMKRDWTDDEMIQLINFCYVNEHEQDNTACSIARSLNFTYARFEEFLNEFKARIEPGAYDRYMNEIANFVPFYSDC
jgi:hypothetical protein